MVSTLTQSLNPIPYSLGKYLFYLIRAQHNLSYYLIKVHYPVPIPVYLLFMYQKLYQKLPSIRFKRVNQRAGEYCKMIFTIIHIVDIVQFTHIAYCVHCTCCCGMWLLLERRAPCCGVNNYILSLSLSLSLSQHTIT